MAFTAPFGFAQAGSEAVPFLQSRLFHRPLQAIMPGTGRTAPADRCYAGQATFSSEIAVAPVACGALFRNLRAC